jgi:hypothetical protein
MRFAGLPVGVLTLLLAASQAHAQIALRWKWKQGEKLTYVLQDTGTSKSVPQSPVGDLEFFELSQDLTLHTTWHVRSVGLTGKEFPCLYSYTFAGRVARDRRSAIKIDVKPELKLPGLEADKDRPKITEQDGKGTVYFDDRAGRITESAVSHRVEMHTTDDTKTTVKLATTTTVKLATENSR